MSGAEELRLIAARVRLLYPDQGLRLLRLADEHQRMAECLDSLVEASCEELRRARESVSGCPG